MAGDWIKMRMDLPDDPAVIGIAEATGLDEDTVVGKLHRIWSWANRQTIDGNAPTVTGKWVDRYIGVPGFVDAMVKVGWLSTTTGGIRLPAFEKHNSETAKQRALTAARVVKHRNAPTVSPSVTKALPEKRREEKREEQEGTDVPSSPHPSSGGTAIGVILPLQKSTWELPAKKLAEYEATFGGQFDVALEIRKARQWLIDNKARQPRTARGAATFLTRWLNRASDEATRGRSGKQPFDTRGLNLED